MRRRDLLLLAASAAAIRNPALAETNTPRIGFVQVGSRQDNQGLLDAFRENLAALGWTDGGNIAVVDRWAEERAEQLPGILKELIGSGVAILVTAGTPPTLAAKHATATTIPLPSASSRAWRSPAATQLAFL
jgi:putative ABC transport system substrate-binding protein